MASRSITVILKSGCGQNIQFLAYALIEHGAIQASNILGSRHIILMGIHVVRAFVQLRNLLASNKEFVSGARTSGTSADGDCAKLARSLIEYCSLTTAAEFADLTAIRLAQQIC